MSDCALCEIVSGNNSSRIVFEDKNVIAFLKQKPAAFGHVILTTKKHYTIFEQIPDIEAAHVFKIANKLSMAVFEALGCGGTNIIIQNGFDAGQLHPHFCIEIIPRRENDGLNFQWANKQLSEEEMSTIELTLKQDTDSLAVGIKEKSKDVVEEKKDTKTISDKKGEENYLLKSLRRIP